MKDKVVDYFFEKIKKNRPDLDIIKLEELRYGLLGLYTLITKTSVIIFLSIILCFFKDFIIFLLFYSILRGVGYGTHAKSNIMCWIYSTVLLLGIPYIFTLLKLSTVVKSIIWSICFLNFVIFCPADTDKRPMINKVRKLKFKLAILIISIIYLVLIFKVEYIANMLLAAMILESFLANPLGYILMGQKVRFHLNDINIFKLK